MDYLNGFPEPNDEFKFDASLPPPPVRLAVMWAFWACSQEQPKDPMNTERTRDGVYPFPDKECAEKYLSN